MWFSGGFSGQFTRTLPGLLLILTLNGCSVFQDTPSETDNDSDNYCLSAGKGQSYDCDNPTVLPYTGPLRIRDLPIDDETLYARVEEIKQWLAQQRAILSGEPLEHPPAGGDSTLIPPAPEALAAATDISNPEETLAAALALTERGDYETALSLIDEYKTLNPDDLSASLIESRILLQSGQLQSAEQLLRWKIKQNPQIPELYNNLAAVQAANGKVGEAITTLQQAFATDPSFARIQQNLKTLYTTSANQALMPDLAPVPPKLNLIDLVPERN
ncbi:tetratricopeptide repeat protein [Marinobacterium sp. D7]|uniref:tetratricopeptide repeat protein n=1 Tax=Marinobacterium ramblicola TaxID=2849041 RepID=UPI001C2CFCC3|nr:tetratricopeptide repeat protein [Marinobacterium ramblicola]MBV1786924.1 tetratricopeptide repeat protein [Marinobacterium ramblicola]